jgi:hypothetical protein
LFSNKSELFRKNTRGWGIPFPLYEENMKPQTKNPIALSVRCTHHDPTGRQCRSLASDARSTLCPRHRASHEQELAADHYQHLTTEFQFFQTAQGINHSLMNLYQLLAQNRISPRRAAVLSYVSSLLLRTLPAIDADRAAGIKFRPNNLAEATPQPVTAPGPGEVADKGPAASPGGETLPSPAPLDTWDPSNPEPDPKKEPS